MAFLTKSQGSQVLEVPKGMANWHMPKYVWCTLEATLKLIQQKPGGCGSGHNKRGDWWLRFDIIFAQ